MEVICRTFYQINNEEESVIKRETNDEFNEYISGLITFVAENKSTRLYKPFSMDTEVVNLICQTVDNFNARSDIDTQENFEKIAKRLLRSELDAQEKIDRLEQKIRKGNLLISLVKESNDEQKYMFMLSKVNNSEFIDGYDLIRKLGFSSETQRIWKTTVFDCEVSDDGIIEIGEIRVYLDKRVAYWCNNFIEIEEMVNDEVNTLRAYQEVEKVLVNNIKKIAPNDYVQLSNTVIGYMRREQLIDYPTMIQDIFCAYIPTELQPQDMAKITEKLNALPEKKNFDYQFNSVPSQIKGRIKKVYKVIPGVELKINDFVENLNENIKSLQDEDGSRYLKIKTTEDSTFRFFDKH